MVQKLMMFATIVTLLSATAYANAQEVYATKNGKKYHKEICRLIKNKNPEKIDMDEALKRGLEPCHLCYKEESTKTLQNDNKNNQRITKTKQSSR